MRLPIAEPVSSVGIEKELFIFATEVPGSLESDQTFAAGELGKSPVSFAFHKDLSFSAWLAHTPAESVMAHLKVDLATLDAMPKKRIAVTPA